MYYVQFIFKLTIKITIKLNFVFESIDEINHPVWVYALAKVFNNPFYYIYYLLFFVHYVLLMYNFISFFSQIVCYWLRVENIQLISSAFVRHRVSDFAAEYCTEFLCNNEMIACGMNTNVIHTPATLR